MQKQETKKVHLVSNEGIEDHVYNLAEGNDD